MLLIDGVRYLETPPKDEDELEQMVVEHAQGIFGDNSIYLDLKHKIKSKSGVGSIPDGYAIILGNTPQWHIIKVELSSHPLHDHIVSQIGKFVSGIKNPNTQAEIVSAIYDEISTDTILIARMRKIVGSNEIYKYLTECISTTPTVTIIIEKATPELDDALEAINHPIKKVIEFRTFVRENAEAVHAHLFEPLITNLRPIPPLRVPPVSITQGVQEPPVHRQRIEIAITSPSFRNYNLFYLSREKRGFFPGYKIPFTIETDIGDFQTKVTAAPKGTLIGDPKGGTYIQGNLTNWYSSHSEIKVGDKIAFIEIEPKKRYRLEIVK